MVVGGLWEGIGVIGVVVGGGDGEGGSEEDEEMVMQEGKIESRGGER